VNAEWQAIMISTNCRSEGAPLAAVRLTSQGGGSRQTSGSVAGLRLCMVMPLAIVLLLASHAWETYGIVYIVYIA